MANKLLLLFLIITFGCSNVSEVDKQELVSELSNELFDLEYDYNGSYDFSVLNGRLKNPFNCTISSLTFEVYLHKAIPDTNAPKLEDGRAYSPEEIFNTLNKPGKVLDQETIRINDIWIEHDETKSFSKQTRTSMRAEDLSFLTQIKLEDFSAINSCNNTE